MDEKTGIRLSFLSDIDQEGKQSSRLAAPPKDRSDEEGDTAMREEYSHAAMDVLSW